MPAKLPSKALAQITASSGNVTAADDLRRIIKPALDTVMDSDFASDGLL